MLSLLLHSYEDLIRAKYEDVINRDYTDTREDRQVNIMNVKLLQCNPC